MQKLCPAPDRLYFVPTRSLWVRATFQKKQRLCMPELVEPAYWLALLSAVFHRRICLWVKVCPTSPTYTSIVLYCLVVVRCQRRSLGNTVCLSTASTFFFFFLQGFRVRKFFFFFTQISLFCSRHCLCHICKPCACSLQAFFRFFTFPDDVTGKYFDCCCCVFIAFVERGKQIICMRSLFPCRPVVATFHK